MNNAFIRINGRYIQIAHIIEIFVTDDDVTITTTELVAESVGVDDWVATNAQVSCRKGTPEYEAVIAWADRQSEVLA